MKSNYQNLRVLSDTLLRDFADKLADEVVNNPNLLSQLANNLNLLSQLVNNPNLSLGAYDKNQNVMINAANELMDPFFRIAIKYAKVYMVDELLEIDSYKILKPINFKAVDEKGKTILDLAKQGNKEHPKEAEAILKRVKNAVKSRHGVVSYYFNEFLEVPGKIIQAFIEAVDYCYKAIEAAVGMILQPFKNIMGNKANSAANPTSTQSWTAASGQQFHWKDTSYEQQVLGARSRRAEQQQVFSNLTWKDTSYEQQVLGARSRAAAHRNDR